MAPARSIDLGLDRTRGNASGRANRIAPDGSNHAVDARGMFWGNRGQLLDRDGRLARHSRGRNWICCVLEFHDRHRTQWQPNRLTELYFLDEATALAAGHRPCGECRHADYQRFKQAWLTAFGLDSISASEIDRHLQTDRLAEPGRHRTHRAATSTLPDGSVVEHADRFWLVRGSHLLAWTFTGYDSVLDRGSVPSELVIRTPVSTVRTLAAGYAPVLHPTADHPAR